MEDSQRVGHAYQCSLSRNCQLYASEKLDWCDRTSGCQEHTHPGTSFESKGKDINLFIDTLFRWQLWCNIYFFSFCLFDSVNIKPISSYLYIIFALFQSVSGTNYWMDMIVATKHRNKLICKEVMVAAPLYCFFKQVFPFCAYRFPQEFSCMPID
jgi:hypothetical protein